MWGTPTALSEVENFVEQNGGEPRNETHLRAELDRRAATALEKLMGTSAVRKALDGRSDAISFYDACGFWDVSVRSNANILTSRLSDIEVLLNRAAGVFASRVVTDKIKLATSTVTGDQISHI
jgi:hypothetical protein